MARAVRPEHPYSSLIDEILALSKRQPGWNSYGARPITAEAQLAAIALVNSFYDRVPLPTVGGAPNGGVVLRWLTPDREIELLFAAAESEYSVLRRDTGELVVEGRLHDVDLIKNLIQDHVLGQRALDRAAGRK